MKKDLAIWIGITLILSAMLHGVIAAPPTRKSRLSIRVRMDRYEARKEELRAGLVDLWADRHHYPTVPVTNHYDLWTNSITGEVEVDVDKVEPREMTTAEKGAIADSGWTYVYSGGTTNAPPDGVPPNQVWMHYDITDLQSDLRADTNRIEYYKSVAGNINTFKILRDGVEQ